MIQFEEERTSPTTIKVIGVGGGGMNAVNRMIDAGLAGVDFIVINTDEQVVHLSKADTKIVIGQKTTRGMGAGGNPDVGLKAAHEDRDRISQALNGADMVFVTAGMGGGTGTGAAPIVAEIAKSMGILVVGVVTMPFTVEGATRNRNAKIGLDAIRQQVDTLITIKNDHIFRIIERNTPVNVALKLIDDILLNAVRGISDLINTAGLINVDFADVKSVMNQSGEALMGAGEGFGENRVMDAVNQAINNVLLDELSMEGATGILMNICGGEDMGIMEWKDVSELVTEKADEASNTIIGLTIDPKLKDRIRVTVIATGFKKKIAKPQIIQRKAASLETPRFALPSNQEPMSRLPKVEKVHLDLESESEIQKSLKSILKPEDETYSYHSRERYPSRMATQKRDSQIATADRKFRNDFHYNENENMVSEFDSEQTLLQRPADKQTIVVPFRMDRREYVEEPDYDSLETPAYLRRRSESS